MDNFTWAYIQCALWASMDNSDPNTGGDPLDKNFGAEDITDASTAKMEADCLAFQENNAGLLSQFYQYSNEEQAGHDFWLNRNRHGSGFWDEEGDKVVNDALSNACKACGEQDLYVGDDGQIHLEDEGYNPAPVTASLIKKAGGERDALLAAIQSKPLTTGEAEAVLGGNRHSNKAYPLLKALQQEGLVKQKQMRWYAEPGPAIQPRSASAKKATDHKVNCPANGGAACKCGLQAQQIAERDAKLKSKKGGGFNKATQDIMNVLGVDQATAESVQDYMGQNGLDFGECTQDEFEEAAQMGLQELNSIEPGDGYPGGPGLGEGSAYANAMDAHRERMRNKQGPRMAGFRSQRNPEWISEAEALIEADDPMIYDVAADTGQIVANVKHMPWFIDAVADWLEEGNLPEWRQAPDKMEEGVPPPDATFD